MRTVVIGAGVGGLSAALQLCRHGLTPIIIEQDRMVGGLAKTLSISTEKGMCRADFGPHRIYTESPQTDAFIRDVLGESFLSVKRSSRLYTHNKWIPYPPTPLQFLRVLGARRSLRAVISMPISKFQARQGDSFETAMIYTLGSEIYNFLLGPYAHKTWKIAPSELHVDVAKVRIGEKSLLNMVLGLLGRRSEGKAATLSTLGYAHGGIQTLPERLWRQASEKGATLFLNHEVKSFNLNERHQICGVNVLDTTCGEMRTFETDYVLSTAPITELVHYFPEHVPSISSIVTSMSQSASKLEFLDMILVYLIVKRNHLTNDQWLYFPDEDLIFNRAYESGNFDPSMSPQGVTTLCFEITVRRSSDDTLWHTDDIALIQQVSSQVAQTGLLHSDDVIQGYVHRLPYAYPLYKLDYKTPLNGLFQDLSQFENLVTFGRQGLFSHNNMDHSIQSAMAVAELTVCANQENIPLSKRWMSHIEHYRLMRIID